MWGETDCSAKDLNYEEFKQTGGPRPREKKAPVVVQPGPWKGIRPKASTSENKKEQQTRERKKGRPSRPALRLGGGGPARQMTRRNRPSREGVGREKKGVKWKGMSGRSRWITIPQ